MIVRADVMSALQHLVQMPATILAHIHHVILIARALNSMLITCVTGVEMLSLLVEAANAVQSVY